MNNNLLDNIAIMGFCIGLANYEENVDQSTMQDMFVIYMKDKSQMNLENMLLQSQQILSEIYHTCSNTEQRNLCLQYFQKISTIK